MLEHYPSVIEAVIELKVYAKQLLCNHKKEIYFKRSEDEVTDIPSDFQLIKDPYTDYVYCCRLDQTL